MFLQGDYKHWDLGPEDQTPKDQRTQSLGGCVALHQLKYNYTGNLCQCYKPKLTALLYVVAMHTEAVIYSRQRYIKLSSDFFDSQRSLNCQCSKARLAHTK